MEPATIILVRHAEVATGGRLCGWYDAPLSARGVSQLEALAERARRLTPPDALCTSPLTRARVTAGALEAAWHLRAGEDEAWREIGCGMLDGRPLAFIERRYPDVWRRNLAQVDDDFAWPGGESYRGFRARVTRLLDRLAQAYPGGTVVVVTHAGVVNQAVGAIRGLRPAAWEPWRPAPLGVTEIAWGNGARELRRFNAPI